MLDFLINLPLYIFAGISILIYAVIIIAVLAIGVYILGILALSGTGGLIIAIAIVWIIIAICSL